LFITMALAGHLCGCGFFFVARWQARHDGSLTWPEVYGIYNVDVTVTTEGKHRVALIMESTPAEAYIISVCEFLPGPTALLSPITFPS
jgi:hypothetical protein